VDEVDARDYSGVDEHGRARTSTEAVLAELAEKYGLRPPAEGEITVRKFQEATGLHSAQAYRTLQEAVERGEMASGWRKVHGKRVRAYWPVAGSGVS